MANVHFLKLLIAVFFSILLFQTLFSVSLYFIFYLSIRHFSTLTQMPQSSITPINSEELAINRRASLEPISFDLSHFTNWSRKSRLSTHELSLKFLHITYAANAK